MNALRQGVLGAIVLSAMLSGSGVFAGEIKGKVTATGLKSAEGIAVYVDTIPGKKFDPPAQNVLVDQRNMLFVPRTSVILKGTTVEFANSDDVGHSVYWTAIDNNKALRHSLTVISPEHKKPFKFDNTGTAQLLCNMHKDMVGYMVVVPTPYFALTTRDGSFAIKDVPPGSYTLKTWSEDGKPTTQSVTVTDAPTDVALTVAK